MWFVWVMWGIVTISIIATIILMTGKGSKFVTGFNTKSTEKMIIEKKEAPSIINPK